MEKEGLQNNGSLKSNTALSAIFVTPFVVMMEKFIPHKQRSLFRYDALFTPKQVKSLPFV